MLRLLCALEAEARPLVARYRLERDPSHSAFKIFRGDGAALVVSGLGKAAAAAAAAYLHLAAGGEDDAVWLDVGIAGGGAHPVGETLLAHKVRDAASGRAWYPPLVFAPPCATAEVVSVDAPELGFAEPVVYDMEASGFVPTARRFASAELVHCLKVVSDGPGSDLGELTAARVAALVEGALPAVERVAGECLELSAELRRLAADPADLEACLARYRFTASDRRQLRRLLRRRALLAPDEPLPLADLPGAARGRDVNRALSRWLDALPVRLPP